MRQNRTSVWKFMTIGISRELSMYNSEHLDILCAWIGHPCDKWWPFEFLDTIRCSILSVSIYYAPESHIRVKRYYHLDFSRASVVQFREYRYIMRLNRVFVYKVMTILISQEHLRCNFERLDLLCSRIGHLCENLWPFEFLESFYRSISSVSISDVPESDIWVKSNDNFNFSGASIVQ